MKSLDDELFDVLLRHAAAQVGREQEEEAERMFEECDRPVDFPLTPAYRRERRRVLRRVRRLERPPAHRARRVAAMVALALTGFGVLSLSVEAIRNRVFEFFLSDFGTHTEITLSSSEPETPLSEAVDPFRTPTWLPKGYVLEESVADDEMFLLTYLKGEESIVIDQDVIDPQMVLGIDTESAVSEHIEIGGLEGLYIEKDRNKKIVFHDDEILITIVASQISRNEIVKIAENIK